MLKVTVSGTVNTGKSAIAQYITEQLISAGFYTENQDLDELLVPVSSDNQADRLCALLDQDLNIEVDTLQLPRKSNTEYITTTDGVTTVQHKNGTIKEI